VFTIHSTSHQTHFEDIADTLDLGYNIVREDDSDHPAEIRIIEHGSVLGRILSILGVPTNKKSDVSHPLPTYLYHSLPHARQFIETWCKHYASGDQKRTITIPPRFGEQFADGLEFLLTEQLDWQITWKGENEFETDRGT
jgi:hypothetical protein